MAYLKAAPKERKKMAKTQYEMAQNSLKRLGGGQTWGSVGKSCIDSALLYPMGKALLLGEEAFLKNLSEKKTDAPQPVIDRKTLERSLGRLSSAIAVESYERSLNDIQRDKLVSSRDCLKRYLDSGKAEPDCAPLQWAGKVSTK